MMKKAVLLVLLLTTLTAIGVAQWPVTPSISFLGYRALAMPEVSGISCSRKGQVYYNTTGSKFRQCTATGSPGTWADFGGGGGGLSSGSAITGGGANRVLFEDGTQNLATNSGFTFSGSQLVVPQGTASAVSIRFGATGPGIWSDGDKLGISTGGGDRVTFSTVGDNQKMGAGYTMFWTNTAGDTTATVDTGISRSSAGEVEVTNGSTTAGSLYTGGLRLDEVTPAQITADQNDYAGCTSSNCRVSTDALRNITGIASGTLGRILKITNSGTNATVLKNENASSVAANRIHTSNASDITLKADQSVTLFWDNTTSRWRDSTTQSGLFTTTGSTNVTLPTTGTLSTLAGAESLTNKKLGSLTTNGPVFTSGGDGTLNSEAQLASTRGGTGVNNAGTLTYGANNITVTTSGVTSVTVPTSGTLATTTQLFGGTGCTNFNVTGSDATTTGTSLVDITGLVTGTLAISSNYTFSAILYVTTTAVTTGTEYGFNVTVAPTRIAGNFVGPTTVASNIQTMQTSGVNANNIATPAFLTTASEEGVVEVRGFFTTAGSGSPVFSLRHLKATSGTSTVKIGSILTVCKQ